MWTQPSGAHDSIWSNRYNPSFGWGSAETIEDYDDGTTREPEVAVAPSGEAVAIWSQRVGGNDEIWSNRLAFRDTD